ncbi:MAG: hypothetical protein LC789_17690, partial [Actinobacteria bacterium]|nr:hypothetical protein [Actinomycetota bacterium]MCA1722333.1 hypothetical protein [Actinomycetota bacterium]
MSIADSVATGHVPLQRPVAGPPPECLHCGVFGHSADISCRTCSAPLVHVMPPRDPLVGAPARFRSWTGTKVAVVVAAAGERVVGVDRDGNEHEALRSKVEAGPPPATVSAGAAGALLELAARTDGVAAVVLHRWGLAAAAQDLA